MEHDAGIDVSLELSSVCVVDTAGRIVREAKVPSEPEALARFFGQLGVPVTRIGLEAGPLSQGLHAGLARAGLEVVLLETRHVKAALSAMVVKTDRKDARGIAQLLRMGWYRPVHRKSPDAQEVRALLVGRKLLQAKRRDVELGIRVNAQAFTPARLRPQSGRDQQREVRGEGPGADRRARDAGGGHRRDAGRARGPAGGVHAPAPPDAGHRARRRGLPATDDGARRGGAGGGHLQGGGGRSDPVQVRQGGRGALRAHAEAPPGGRDRHMTGGISKAGDALVRTALDEAANVILSRPTRFSGLKRWAMEVARRRGLKRAKVALARKLAGVLQRMGADGTDFRWGEQVQAAA
jgi:transposase